MPIDPTGTPNGAVWRLRVIGPDDVYFNIELSPGTETEGQSDDATQSLLDHLAMWPDLTAISEAVKVTSRQHAITVTP